MTTSDYIWSEQECPTCNRLSGRYLGRRGGSAHRQGLGVESRIWQCEQCSLIFPHPMPTPRQGLSQHYAIDSDLYFRNHRSEEKEAAARRILGEAQSILGRTGTVLDVGCGRGELLRAAGGVGWTATGVEPSPTFAAVARESGASVIESSVEACPLPPASFDVVILAAVLEHLYTPDATVAAIARLLRPGGLLFLDVPNEMGLYFRVGNLYQRLRRRDWVVNLAPTFEPFHVFGFSPRSLNALLDKHRLKLVRRRIFAGTDFLPAIGGATSRVERWATRLITRLSGTGTLGTYIEGWAQKDGAI